MLSLDRHRHRETDSQVGDMPHARWHFHLNTFKIKKKKRFIISKKQEEMEGKYEIISLVINNWHSGFPKAA